MENRLRKELQFSDYLRMGWKNRWVLALSLASFIAPSYYLTQRLPDTYVSISQLVMEENQSSALLMGDFGSSRNYGYYQTLFQSAAFREKVARAAADGWPEKGLDKDAVLEKALSLGEGNVAGFLSLYARTSDAETSLHLAKIATDSLVVFCKRVGNEEADNAIAAIREQIEVCLRKREEIQEEKNRLSDVARLAALGDWEGLKALEKSYQDELVKYELDKAGLNAKRNYFESLDREINKKNSQAADPEIEGLKQRLKDLEKEKERMLRMGLTLSPESRVSREIDELESELSKRTRPSAPQDLGLLSQWQTIRKEVSATEGEMRLKKARLDAFKRAIVEYREQHPDLGQQEFRISQLDNLLERYTETHRRLTEKLEDALIQTQSKSGGLKVVDAPTLPDAPIPRKDYVFILIALAAGLAVGVGLSFLREFLDDSIKSPDDVERQLAITLLGTIPHINVKKTDLEVKRNIAKGKKVQVRNRYPELVMGPGKEESVVAEAYRSLRTNIVFASPDKPVKTLLITSSGPGEGKSLTMANTALSFAQQGEPTLIVDTDLRRPVVHHLFGLERGPGFGEWVAGTMDLDQVARAIPGTNLHVITAGAYMPNPAEVLGSRRMDRFLELAKERFHYVLFDTPPVIAVTDASILASKVDGVALVVRAGKTSLHVAMRTLQSLRTVNSRLIGGILNDVDLTKGYSSYGYYKHYYHYYVAKKD